MFEQAEALSQQKKYAEALELYETILTQNPAIVGAYRGVVSSYNGLGDSQGALIFIEALFLEYPESAEVNYGLGYALFSSQKYEQAAHYFEKAIELNPNLAEAWNNRAAIYQFIENDGVKARQFYVKAIDLAEQSGNGRVIEIAQKNLSHLPEEEVLTPVKEPLTLEQFLNRFVTQVEAQNDKALRELILGQKRNCQAAMDWLLEEALKASVQTPKGEDNTALLLAQILENKYGKVFKDTTLKKKKDRFDHLTIDERRLLARSETLLEQGLAYEQNGVFNEAAERYKAALVGFKKMKMMRKTGITHVYLGDVYGKQHQYVSSQKAYHAALPYFDQDADAEYKARILASLGQACFKTENYQTALENMTQSLKIYRQLKNEAEAEKLEKNIEVVKMKLRN